MSQPATYIIRGGIEGKKRLEVVSRVLWPTTSRLLTEAGIAEGQQCLDLGCGGGDVTLQLARLVGPTGCVTGIDMDETKLELARHSASEQSLENVEFRRVNVQEWNEEGCYDLIYARFLLTHLADPHRMLRQMLHGTRPGGVAVVEDVEFAGHFSYPNSGAFDAYVRLYRAAAARQGADADIGPKLFGMFLDAGWQDVRVNVVQPVFAFGEGKQIAHLTLVNIADSLLSQKLTTEAELQPIIDVLTRFTEDERTLIALPRIFQVWGRRPH